MNTYKRSYALEQELVKKEACDWDRFRAFFKLTQELEKEIHDLDALIKKYSQAKKDENKELIRAIGSME